MPAHSPSKSRPEIVARIKEIEVGRTARGGSKHLTDQEIANTAGVSRAQVQDDLNDNNKKSRTGQNVTTADDDILDAEIVEDDNDGSSPRAANPTTAHRSPTQAPTSRQHTNTHTQHHGA